MGKVIKFPRPFGATLTRNLVTPEPKPSIATGERRSERIASALERDGRQREHEQGRMRKEAALMGGEWTSSPAGLALFLPSWMLRHAWAAVMGAMDEPTPALLCTDANGGRPCPTFITPTVTEDERTVALARAKGRIGSKLEQAYRESWLRNRD